MTTSPLPEFVDLSDEIEAALDEDPSIAETIAVMRSEQAAHQVAQHRNGLALLRQAMGLTQAQVAEQLGLSQPAVATAEVKDDLMATTIVRTLDVSGAYAIVRFHDGTEAPLEEILRS